MLRKSTNLLLTRTLSGCLQNLIKKPHIGLTELVQIIINTTHLEQACKYLEDFITNITNVSPETVHTTRLYGLSTFKDARHAAEGEIYTKLNQKIDEFIQLADYDWGIRSQRPGQWIPYGPHQLPPQHLPGFHTPAGELAPSPRRQGNSGRWSFVVVCYCGNLLCCSCTVLRDGGDSVLRDAGDLYLLWLIGFE
ncbi:exocyst complex component 6 [Salvelinus sp. IW2-2015]|uniref:exocyst complex component 6 n=1 Tax=Salvelinus sp. IW2-2015 TaxID=2691554 RepID=UPI000CEAF9DD|nr:exocyst complex component 6-like [Salvelinus alpinus]